MRSSLLSPNILKRAYDDVLVQSTLTLRKILKEEEEAIGEAEAYLNEIRETLGIMEAEAERRGLELPEENNDDFARGN